MTKHGFHSTTVKHHKDGSHTVHHHHMDPEKDIEHAVADHNGMMDSMQQHLGEPAGEAEAAGPEGAGAGGPMPVPAAA